MIYIHWLGILLYVLIVAFVAGTVLMDNRQPAKTMAWMLVLFFLPAIGIVLYFFFGRNTRKERVISQRSLDQLTKRAMLEFAEQRDLNLPEDQYALMMLFSRHNWALPFKNNEVDIFTDGYDFFHALLREIAVARHHIHIDTYIFEDDSLGTMVADALIARSQAGVEVRVIYDDVGCWNVKGEFYERMRDAGIEVHAFMPVRFPAFTSKVNYRNHRKICVIDGTVGFIGGMNIATRYVKGRALKKHRSVFRYFFKGNQQSDAQMPQESPRWRDTHLRIRGGAVYGIQKAFLVDWYFVDRTLISNRSYYPELSPTVNNNCLIQIVTSSPVSPWPDMEQGYVRILLQAKRYVYIETPYFLPTEPVLFAMRTAALAGVDVRLMVPRKNDARLVEWASISYVLDTVESGVRVFLFEGGFNHSKLLVSDDELCTCGSTNVDFRSFENNFEGNAFIFDKEMALRMKQVFLEDEGHSRPLEELFNDKHQPSFLVRFWSSIVRLLSPLM